MTFSMYTTSNYNHPLISIILAIYLCFLYFNMKNLNRMLSIVKSLIIFNCLIFYGSLLFMDTFDFKVHLPLHLCYLTEIFILISLLFKTQFLYPWLVLNGLGGGITGFTNTNLPIDSLLIENIHLHLSHFNLLLFVLILHRMNFSISKKDFYRSIIFNAIIFSLVVWFNNVFQSNYWFTASRPPGTNLALLFPDWPYYLYGLIIIGLASYVLTFRLFSRNFSR